MLVSGEPGTVDALVAKSAMAGAVSVTVNGLRVVRDLRP